MLLVISFSTNFKAGPVGGRCAAVLGRRTPDGGRARITSLPGLTTGQWTYPRQGLTDSGDC